MPQDPTMLLLLLRFLRLGLLFCALCVALFLAIEVWKNWLSGAHHLLALPDYVFMGVLVAVFTATLALARAISREISKMETMGPDGHR